MELITNIIAVLIIAFAFWYVINSIRKSVSKSYGACQKCPKPELNYTRKK